MPPSPNNAAPESDAKPIRCVQYLKRIRIADGGIVRFLLNYCQDLADQGHHVTLLTEDDADVPPVWRSGASNHPHVVVIGRTAEPIEEVLRAAEVVHFHCLWDVYLRRLVALADRYNVPYVVSTHGMLNDWAMVYKPWRKRIYLNIAGRRLLNRAAAVHCTCEGERKQALNWLPRDNVRIVPLSFDRTEFDQLPGPELSCAQFPDLSVDATKLLMLGRLHPVKRVELVIDAVVKLRKQNISAHLYLAGPAEDARYVAQLQDAVSRHDLHDFVHFLGTVDGELKVSLYQACDLFLLPSWQENFGMGVPESLAAQTPAITTRCVDPWREFEAAGARIAEPTAESFAATIAEMVRDPVSMEELAHRGRDHVLLWLDPHTVLGRFTAMYGEAIGQRVRAS